MLQYYSFGLFWPELRFLLFSQGGAPSPFDRNFSTKISAKAMQWITRTLKDSFKGGKIITI